MERIPKKALGVENFWVKYAQSAECLRTLQSKGVHKHVQLCTYKVLFHISHMHSCTHTQAFEAQRLRYLEAENAELLQQVEQVANAAAEAARVQYR